MKRITIEYLKQHNVEPPLIDFMIRNRLIGIPFDVVDKIDGYYNKHSSMFWLKELIYLKKIYDSNGNLLLLINDDEEVIHQYGYDESKRIIYENCHSYVSLYRYNDNDQLIWMKDDYDRIHQFEYDTNGNKVKVHITDDNITRTTFYHYNEDHTLSHESDNKGIIKTYEYKDNRLYSITSHTNLIEYYDDHGNLIGYNNGQPFFNMEYWCNGQLKQYDGMSIPWF